MDVAGVGAVILIGNGNKAHLPHGEILLDIVAGVDGVASKTRKVFHDDAVDITSLNIRKHLLKRGTVEICARRAVVDVFVIYEDVGVFFEKTLQYQHLRLNGNSPGVLILDR